VFTSPCCCHSPCHFSSTYWM